jgi:spermidine synthase
MNETATGPQEAAMERRLPLLLLLMSASGCAALVYEIVWYHLLQLAIGSTAVSLGFLLAAFMGGLSAGSVALPRLAPRSWPPLRLYAAIELGIAALGLLVLAGVPLVDRVYVAGVEHGLPGMLLRAFISGVCLLPPTFLMGASLPAISRWIQSTPRGASWWGLLYGANTAGAVFGCVLAGFYLLRLYDTIVATLAAAALNVAVALASLWLASRTPANPVLGEENGEAAPGAGRARSSLWPVYLTIALSGAGALGAEVIWTRLMGMMLGSTVYVFSIILAVFLVGLALGTAGGAWLARQTDPRAALGWCQVLLAAAIAWAACMIARSLPYWPVNPMLTTNQWHTFQLDIVRCLWAMLPPTLLWGASFPLALSAAAAAGRDPGRVVGGVYAANTLGAIMGALSVSLVLVPWIGTRQSQRTILLLSAASGLILLVPYAWRRGSRALGAALAAVVIAAAALAWSVEQVPGELIAYGRHLATTAGNSRIIHRKEGRNSSVVVTEWPNGTLELAVNGHVQATTAPYDMKLQRMVGHLPALIHPAPESVLGIGFGAGVSAGTFTRYKTIKRITVCEIEPVIPPISNQYFGFHNYNVLEDPRTRIVYDDARHYLMTATEKFDIIASDPLDVFAKGTAALYSYEYFEAVKKRLKPGGIFTLYVPLYETDERTIKSELATFFEAFPDGTVWANTIDGRGYDMVFMGGPGPMNIDLAAMHRRLDHPDYAAAASSLSGIGVNSPIDLLATYAGRKADLAPWLKGAQITRDKDLRLQYLAGWGINNRLEDRLYRAIVAYRQRPEGLFAGSPEQLQALYDALTARQGYY